MEGIAHAMNVYYHRSYNIDLGPLNLLHPFDGMKSSKVHDQIKHLEDLPIRQPAHAAEMDLIDSFAGTLLRDLLRSKRYVLAALEVPYIPLLPFSVIDKRVLAPMRWGVAGTLAAARDALNGANTWNLSGGYHHASRKAAGGFCIYNDIGITLQQLIDEGKLSDSDPILIVDIDAHHGNGNAHVFMDHKNVCLLDIYNAAIYPSGELTRKRVNIGIPLQPGTSGRDYLSRLGLGLAELSGKFRLAFVVAGTDVLASDPLGGLGLSIDDCVARDQMVLERLHALSVPAVFVGGGGYGRDSAKAVVASISNLYKH
jgi:histone deacetylase 11